MTRVRHRRARSTRLAALTPGERWRITYGSRESSLHTTAWWDRTFEAVRDELPETLDDPAVTFRAFWLYDPVEPDELREDLDLYDHVMLSEPRASEVKAEYEQLMERRPAWLREQVGQR